MLRQIRYVDINKTTRGRKPMGNRPELGERPRAVLRAIAVAELERKACPTIRELGKITDISSTSVVNYYLDQLENFALISRERFKTRSIYITDQGRRVAGLKITKHKCPNCGCEFGDDEKFVAVSADHRRFQSVAV